MPTQADDLPVEPSRIQAAVGQHQDGPIGGYAAVELLQQGQPVGFPSTWGVARQDDPGHRDRTTAIHDTDGQHGEQLAQARGIHRQRQPLLGRRPGTQHPGQQGHKTAVHIQGLAVGAFLVGGVAIPLAQALAKCRFLAARYGRQEDDDAGQAARLAHHHAKAPHPQHRCLGLTQVGQMG